MTTATNSPAIEAVGLEKTFKGDVRALDGVTFSVERGTVFGLLGPNGAGKTTVIRILTTILPADAGHARVLGHDVVEEAARVRTLIGLAGQNAAVDENLTGRENIQMVARLNHLSRSKAKSKANELLERFGLADAGDRTLRTYSGGMRRRLDLAAALVAEPGVLFFDEPTTGLDPQSRNDLWQVIEELTGQGTTVLLTTQYLEEADRLASRVAVVDKGRLIAEGTPADLKEEMGSTVLEIVLADKADVKIAADTLIGIGTKPPTIEGVSIDLHIEGGAVDAMEALRRLDQATLIPVRFALREPSLDDVFLSLTGKKAESDQGGSQP